MHNCERTSVYNASSGLLAVVNGLEDVIVAVTDGAVYVTRADCADAIRDLDSWGAM